MTVEDNIYAALKSLVSGRVERDLYKGAIKPYIVFQQVGGIPLGFLEAAMPSKRNGRFQVCVWDLTRDGAAAIARQAEQVLVESPTLIATAETAMVAIYEPETGLYGTRQHFSIWY